MADLIFENPRLVSVYDAFDGKRSDLDSYLSLVNELDAKSILDIGCGTGSFASILAGKGFEVIGIDPAEASLRFAKKKPNAEKVRWLLGDTASLPKLTVDLAIMTGNVAQVFLTDTSWHHNLTAIRRVLQPQGHLVFEVRDPSQKAWLDWSREKTFQRINVPNVGYVSCWCEVINAANDLVSFRWTYTFESDSQTLTSDSTLRFRSRAEIESSLHDAGYSVEEVRDAPDRPGMEFVFVATAKNH